MQRKTNRSSIIHSSYYSQYECLHEKGGEVVGKAKFQEKIEVDYQRALKYVIKRYKKTINLKCNRE